MRVLLTVTPGMLHVQLPQYGRAPGAEAGQQQSCDVNDPACQGNSQGRTSPNIGSTVSNSTTGQFRPRNDVKLSEPDIDWSKAVIERQGRENLTISLLPFNLGSAVIEGDEWLPGDVLNVFSKRNIRVPQSRQTRFVRLEGEFISSGVYVYSVRLGEILRELVRRAGGPSPEAYLYESELTPESTSRVQQQRLNAYIVHIQMQACTSATDNTGRAISAQETAAIASAQQQNQTSINSLRQARATSRDGAVYNQNSFLFDPHRRLGDYIHLAAGASRDADKNRAFVIRASGGVVSKQYDSSLRGNGFESLHLYIGDTVVYDAVEFGQGKNLRLISRYSPDRASLG